MLPQICIHQNLNQNAINVQSDRLQIYLHNYDITFSQSNYSKPMKVRYANLDADDIKAL